MKILLQNKRASYDYVLQQKHEAGIVLTGDEVKSLKTGHGKLRDAHVFVKNAQVTLSGVHVPMYKCTAQPKNHDADRPRTLLMHKREARRLEGVVSRQGLTLIPTKLYIGTSGHIKVEIALAKGKTKADKRNSLREKDWTRQQQELLKKRSSY